MTDDGTGPDDPHVVDGVHLGDHRRVARVLAVVAVLAGAVWLWGLGSAVAVVCGLVARLELARFDDATSRRFRLVADVGLGLGLAGGMLLFLVALEVI